MGRLFLARHGETEWTLNRRHTGTTEVPLTPAGEEQARTIAAKLGDAGFEVVASSPRGRAVRTAELAGHPDPVIWDDATEFDYGEYEGLTSAEIKEARPGWQLWRDGCPGGETPGAVEWRADHVLKRLKAIEGDVLLFGHGHFSRALGARWIGHQVDLAARLMLGTAAVCVLGHEHGQPAIEHWSL
ncbi:MAG: histidine phosphatase family protein [Thermoleophilaceae bacterium]|nr:histidine phosphatase family protein [Thermoleophilaceae bacterium]